MIIMNTGSFQNNKMKLILFVEKVIFIDSSRFGISQFYLIFQLTTLFI